MDLIPQTGPHLHILLNHFPSIGLVIAIGLYITAFVRRSDELKRICLVLFVVLGILAIPTYISGTAAMWALAETPGISRGLINIHRELALFTFAGLGITGGVAWLILWQGRHVARLAGRPQYAVLALAVITLALMTETGHHGGMINHPEILFDEPIPADDLPGPWTAALEGFNVINWLFPVLETLHFLGMAMIFGTVLVVALRVLGLAKSLPFVAVHRLLPLGFIGLMINVVTGMVLFIGDSARYVAMNGFPPKIALLVIGALAVLYFSLSERTWNVREGEDAPITAKAVAVVTLLAWTGVIIFGRLLPYTEGI